MNTGIWKVIFCVLAKLFIILSHFSTYINAHIKTPNFFLKNLKIFVFSIAKFFLYGMIESEIKETN